MIADRPPCSMSPMSLALYASIAIAFLVAGYFLYGRRVARIFALDDRNTTPAYEKNDGEDYVPTKPLYLFAQHFSAIAAAGPIAGPIIACQQFGWLPAILWIALGVVFIGAVHDFSALVASVRHGAGSVVEITRSVLGRRAALALMVFIWLSLVYVIIAFTDITSKTFIGKSPEIDFEQGGAVAGASTMYLALAVLMGLVLRLLRPPLWLATLLFVPATLGVIWLGTVVPHWFVLGAENPAKVWAMLILGYCFFAAFTPVWALLQPRGYLGGFLLFIALAVGVAGILIGSLLPGTREDFTVQQAAFRGWTMVRGDGSTVSLFPFLFVTIACGACSGFHGLVCSGTTSKQVERETHCHPIGYGAMLLEGLVAVIALATVMILTNDQIKGMSGPGTVYGSGLGKFLTVFIGKEHVLFATTFGAMAFSTFVFDTLDICTRLGRLLLVEVFGWRSRAGQFVATGVTVAAPAYVLWTTTKPAAYMEYWILFGTSNQLLAGLTFLGITMWLHKNGRPVRYTLPPMVFMMTITFWSLGKIALDSFRGSVGLNPTTYNGVVAVALGLLAATLLAEAIRTLRAPVARSAPA